MMKLGIIAGHGDLLNLVLDACQARQIPYFVLAYEGQTHAHELTGHPHQWLNIAKAGETIQALKRENVTDVVMAGRFFRPASWSSLRPDIKGAKLLARIVGRPMGDDGLFRVLISFLEDEGFKVRSVEDIAGSQLLMPQGTLTKVKPDAQASSDIKRGIEVAQALGRVDVGQAVVVQHGLILGVEAAEGTNALIERTRCLAQEGSGGVLIKILKPGQEARVDRSVLGPSTIKKSAKAGLRGVAVQAKGAILLKRNETVKLADDLGIFLTGVTLE
jgi:DUF1009 family protein